MPFWISSYNFLSLLNLSEEVRDFGSIRDLWEGSFRGEKFVKEVKPLMQSGLQKDWSKHVMNQIWSEKINWELRCLGQTLKCNSTISSNTASSPNTPVLDPTDSNEYDDDGGDISSTQKMYKIYDSLVKIQFSIAHREPMSVILLDDGRMGFVIRSYNASDDKYMAPVYWKGETADTEKETDLICECGGMLYREICVVDTVSSLQPLHGEGSFVVADYGILLPLLHYDKKAMDGNVFLYTMITHKWDKSYFVGTDKIKDSRL